jgi:thioredoxin reductase (NADPH)
MNLVITDCTNNGEIIGTSNGNGGILGTAIVSSGSNILVDGCTNNGKVESTSYSGGIVAYIYNAADDVVNGATYKITGCTNNGSVTTTSGNVAGGIFGFYNNISTGTENNVLVIEKSGFGGQITHSPRVENYPGFTVASGSELGDKFLEGALTQGAEIELDTVLSIEGEGGDFTVHCEGSDFKAKSVIIAAGSKHRTLGLPGEERYTGEGISYCAVCDGAFYKGKSVAIIGGGNTALQEAALLADGCEKVYVIQNLAFFTGEKNLASRLDTKRNIEVIFSTVVTGIIGEGSFKGITLKNTESGKESVLMIDGMFVAIGQKPENEAFTNLTELNKWGYIEAAEDCLTSTEGLFVAGDCRSKSVRQITTATADGAVAALAACRYIDNL